MTHDDVQVGDTVYWYPQCETSRKPIPAVVTSIGAANTLCLSAVEPDRVGLRCLDGVKHVSDPTIKEADRVDNGAWDYSERHKRMKEMFKQLQDAKKEESPKESKGK